MTTTQAATTVPAIATSCTLPPDLVNRFVRMRAWYLDYRRRERKQDDEIAGRFYAGAGITEGQLWEMGHDDPRRKPLDDLHSQIIADVFAKEGVEDETNRLGDERWGVAEEMLQQRPQTVVDLAYMAEALLIADLELLHSGSDCTADRLQRLFFSRVRALGALPQPNDPLGELSLDDTDDDEVPALAR
jgi:hypothetical protein